MWLNCTRSNAEASLVAKVVEVLSSDAHLSQLRGARGFRGFLLVESTETPGEIISITWWESAEDGQAYLASPECQRVVGSVQGYLVKPLERGYYDVRIQTSP